MIFSKSDRQAFETSVCQWLTDWRIPHKLDSKETHAKISTAQPKMTLVLDFMVMPYQGPETEGFLFGIDHFICRKEALRSRLSSLFQLTKRIHGRETQITRLRKKQAQPFFDRFHLAGYRSGKFNFGLFHKKELVAAITFAQGRNFKNGCETLRSYEWIGYCTASEVSVTGGLSKLINHFVKLKAADHITTYVDRAWATSRTLTKLGFRQVEELNPLPFYIDEENGKRVFPSRKERKKNDIGRQKYPFLNSGYTKFQHFYG